MKLKEIKPGMVIHCKNYDEKKALYDELCRIGNIDTSDGLDSFQNFKYSYDGNYEIKDLKGRTWGFTDEHATVEFSDLIIPELTAEEVLQIATDICNISDCDNGCPLAAELDDFTKQCMICPKSLKTYSETVPIICQQWKSDHEKKEPEIETVDICRIIEVIPDGRKRCVYEEEINVPELPLGVFEQDKCKEILKHYCMDHDGEFIAVHEVVSRVKAVE